MKAYVITTLNIPIEISDKFAALRGWTPKSNDRDLKDECWEEAFKALEGALEKIGVEDDYDCTAVLDEDEFILVK